MIVGSHRTDPAVAPAAGMAFPAEGDRLGDQSEGRSRVGRGG